MKKIINYDKNEIKHIHLTSIISDYIVNDKKMRVDIGYIYEYCPFCTHKNHFQINTKENLYNSFNGCCKGGDIISFVMEVEGLNFKQAIENLGDRFNINKTSTNLESSSKREREILKILSEYEEDRLKKEENRFFDFLKFMEYEDIFFKALPLVGTDKLIHYIYNLKGMGIYE
jgi:DNA primase